MRLHAIKSWYDSRQGMITLEDDVQSVVSQVREAYGDRITVELDESNGYYHFVGHENGADYLIFTTSELDGRALERLFQSDSTSRGHVDSYKAAERDADAMDKEKEYQQRQMVHAMGEELLFSLIKEGKAPRMPKHIYVSKDLKSA